MKILASGGINKLHLEITCKRPNEKEAYEIINDMNNALTGVMPAKQHNLSSGGTSVVSMANGRWHLPKVGGEILASKLKLVSIPRVVSYDALLDAISDAGFAYKAAIKAQNKV
jgi:hypothetical protein